MNGDWLSYLYNSIIGYASLPEIIWTSEALLALYLRIRDRRRAQRTLKAIPAALKNGMITVDQIPVMQRLLKRRIQKSQLHIPIKLLFVITGAVQLFSPDSVRPNIQLPAIIAAYSAIAILTLMLLDLIQDERLYG